MSANTSTSPTVTFSMLQEGRPLSIHGLETPINISIPFRPSLLAGRRLSHGGEQALCIGAPAHAEAAALCDVVAECRFWNASEERWSTAGCITVLEPDGTIGCRCDHLTEFIAFEYPASSNELVETFFNAIQTNSLSLRAFQCAFNPSRSRRTVPVIWGCTFVLIFFFVALLSNAIYRDRIEIFNTVMLLKGNSQVQTLMKARAEA